MMRKLLLLSCLFISSLSFASDKAQLKNDFKQAYKAYQQALSGNDLAVIEVNAKKSYELGCQLFAKASDNCITLTTNYATLVSSPEKMEQLYATALVNMEKEYGKNSLPVAHFAIATLTNERVIHHSAFLLDTSFERIKSSAQELLKTDPTNAAELLVSAAKSMEDIYNLQWYRQNILEYAHDLLQPHFESGSSELIYILHLAAHASEDIRDKEKAVAQYKALIAALASTQRKEYNQIEALARRYLIQTHYDTAEANQHIAALQGLKDWSDDIRPVLRYEPVYPSQAARDNEEGWVELTFIVDEQGKTANIEVVDSSSRIFNRSAKNAIRTWRYLPRVVKGVAEQTGTLHSRLDFSMKN